MHRPLKASFLEPNDPYSSLDFLRSFPSTPRPRLCRMTCKARHCGNASSRCVERQPDSPHPDPLPRGGGQAAADSTIQEVRRPDTALSFAEQRSILPLLKGEGRGEGKREARGANHT